ncbi:MAG: M20/M25/M40 family metallo-hydrolase, partial [Thermoanaerobaculia bacterium]|nr:M20/M25/M40 family metallo-hydrolase [Thermoanaerobaculia bacterium]
LAEEGIDSQLLGDDPERQSLYARLESGRETPALILTHHIDVVPARSENWSVEPFSAPVREGYVWGRGAIDAKSLGIAHLISFIDLARSVGEGAALSRDVILLAVADEETGGLAGTASLLEKHPELFEDVGYVLNEGGGNQVVVDETIFWGIEIDQKIPLWIELESTGAGGHGAGIHDDSAVIRLLRALDSVRGIKPARSVTPSVRSYFEAVSKVKKGHKATVLAEIDQYVASPQLDSVLPAGYLGLLQDTWTISVLEAGRRVNVVPEQARAQIDVRLRPGTDSAQLLEEFRNMVSPHADVTVLLEGEPAPPSPVDTDLWQSIEKVLTPITPSGVIGPMVALGTTDSRFYRQRGIVAYGFSPYKINFYDVSTVHGADERIRLNFLLEGIDVMKQIARDFCLEPQGAE